MPSRSTVPALKWLTTSPVARSTMTMWLFSCSVTTAWSRLLMSTYSGSDHPVHLGEAGEVDTAHGPLGGIAREIDDGGVPAAPGG